MGEIEYIVDQTWVSVSNPISYSNFQTQHKKAENKMAKNNTLGWLIPQSRFPQHYACSRWQQLQQLRSSRKHLQNPKFKAAAEA